jgi:hypothetical protein
MMNREKGLTQSERPFDYFQPAAANKSSTWRIVQTCFSNLGLMNSNPAL